MHAANSSKSELIPRLEWAVCRPSRNMAELGALYYDSVSSRSILPIELLKGFKSRIKCIVSDIIPAP
jgi:hypothetical protein